MTVVSAFMHPGIQVFMVLWFAFAVGLYALILLGLALIGPFVAGSADRLWMLFFPLLVILGGPAIVATGRYLARNERALLVELLVRTVKADVVDVSE